MAHYLKDIQSPKDLKQLAKHDLPALAREVRKFLIDSISKTGGHLASNLGVVELTIALHYVFDSPNDKIIWDVGHQCYVHKIITGRQDRFDTLRQENGLSGFPKAHESEHDVFVAGHSSNSVSAGLGFAKALALQGKDDFVIAVIGDGAFTGGMVYEALNNAGREKSNLIVILNHNDMSISPNVGAVAKYLVGIRVKPAYLKAKNAVRHTLLHLPVIGRSLYRGARKSKRMLKGFLYPSTAFEELGFSYLGPVDGHNIDKMICAFKNARRRIGPVLIHVDTIKGKGYTYAEANPGAYHGVGKFDVASGKPCATSQHNFSSTFGSALCALATTDKTICAVTAAMKDGTGLQRFAEQFSDRFFDVGIAEQHAITFCAGLASQGMKPVFAVYSTFLQRGYDQLIHDCAIEKQHLVLAIDRAGVVGEDGETHQGLFDVSFLGGIPDVTIFSPETYQELTYCLHQALYHTDGVVAVRYPRGSDNTAHCLVAKQYTPYLYQPSQGDKGKVLLVTYGRLTQQVMQAAEGLLAVSVLKLIAIAPIPAEVLEICKGFDTILFYEEGVVSGGVAQQLLCQLHSKGYRGEMKIFGITSPFIPPATVTSVFESLGFDARSIAKNVRSMGIEPHK